MCVCLAWFGKREREKWVRKKLHVAVVDAETRSTQNDDTRHFVEFVKRFRISRFNCTRLRWHIAGGCISSSKRQLIHSVLVHIAVRHTALYAADGVWVQRNKSVPDNDKFSQQIFGFIFSTCEQSFCSCTCCLLCCKIHFIFFLVLFGFVVRISMRYLQITQRLWEFLHRSYHRQIIITH